MRPSAVSPGVAREHGKPLTVDIQDAYGDRFGEAINALLDVGVRGVNLEDAYKDTGRLYSIDEAVARVKRVLKVAADWCVPDFVVNARSDAVFLGLPVDEAIVRGKKYLEAGATTVFIWGGSSRGLRDAEVARMIEAFDGRLNVSKKADGLSVKELARMGVTRISVGPALQSKAMATYAQEAEKLLTGA